MPQIELSDEVYARALRQAKAHGFESVEAYIAHELGQDDERSEIEAKFTPAVLAELDRIVAERKAGGLGYTMEDVMQMLAETRANRKAS